MKKYYLWLIMVFGAGNPDINELLTRFGTAEEIYRAFKNNCAAAGRDYAEKAEKITLEEAEKLTADIESKDIRIITIEDEIYPEALKSTENPPAVFFARGNTDLLGTKLLTIGGTRRATEYTIAAETKICEELCREYTLVASLCAGCEQLACLSAIKQSRGCIEALPCGHDYEYPAGSAVMRRQILMNGGCIISEFLPETKSSNANYLKRARIAGGISKAMIVFQAGANSGSLNAAKYSPALFFIPPEDVFSGKYSAAVSGVRNGARLYLSPSSLKPVYEEEYKPKRIKFDRTASAHKKDESPKISEEIKVPAPKDGKTEIPEQDSRFESENHAKVYRLISEKDEAVTFDEIFRNLDGDISDVSEILLDLEIEGKIKAVAGNRYEKA